MKVFITALGTHAEVKLSHRNLMDLVEALKSPDYLRRGASLLISQSDGFSVRVTAENDAEHYKGRDFAGPGINYSGLKPVSEM